MNAGIHTCVRILCADSTDGVVRQDVLRARTLADPDDPLAGLFVRTGKPAAAELQSTEEHARAQNGDQTAEGPEDWEASGEEEEEARDPTAATAALAAAAHEQLAQKQQAWKRELALYREPMIDMGVYTKNRCFRMYLCAKFGNDDPAR